jgi:glycosyltransferase involved in cell wall biosynthesis
MFIRIATRIQVSLLDEIDISMKVRSEGAIGQVKTRRRKANQRRLRQIAWRIGRGYRFPLQTDYVALHMVHPRCGYVHWNLRNESAEALRTKHGERLQSASVGVRIYDVTDILFDGLNAHQFSEVHVPGLAGSHYFRVERVARDYLAEVGLRGAEGRFYPLARSRATFFDRDGPSRNYRVSGLFVGGALKRIFSVESIFDAPVYEKLNRQIAGMGWKKGSISVAVTFLDLNHEMGEGSLRGVIKKISEKCRGFGGRVLLFAPRIMGPEIIRVEVLDKIRQRSEAVCKQIEKAHGIKPFQVVHCHDWYSSVVGLTAAKRLSLPLVLSLHSTEHERTQGNVSGPLSSAICMWERAAVEGANLVIVPHSSTRRQVISLYKTDPDRIVIVPDVLGERSRTASPEPLEAKRWLGLSQDAPIGLFAGEISHASGADLLLEALPTVCRNHSSVQFVFAGEGPLRGELEARAWHMGIGHRCRFLGDVPADVFERLLAASEFVVIPAREWQDEGLARMAIGHGKPVLTTRQAGMSCIKHGENGLITFDNPGSIVWGIQELLFNPPTGSPSLLARKNDARVPSLDTIAAQHYLCYHMATHGDEGSGNA